MLINVLSLCGSSYGRSGDSLVIKTADTTLEQDVQKRSSLVDVSTVRLNVIIGRLRLAYLGSSVDWSDTGMLYNFFIIYPPTFHKLR